jgi:hypothetical protein
MILTRETVQKYINKETNGQCPKCEDSFSATVGNLYPTWSDQHDNIVCYSCHTASEGK